MFKTPHTTIRDSNPLFDFEARRVKWLGNSQQLWRYSMLLQIMPILILVCLYIAAVLGLLIQRNSTRGLAPSDINNFVWGLLALITLFLYASGLVAIIAGFYYVGVTVHSINKQRDQRQWDLLRLTPLSEETIYEAKQRIGEVRGWRLLTIEVSLRLLAITLVLLIGILPPNTIFVRGDYFSRDSLLGEMSYQLAVNPSVALLDFSVVGVLIAAYLLEPRWRMRALLAMGLEISSRIGNISLSSLAAFLGVFGFHLVQGLWLTAVFGVISTSNRRSIFGASAITEVAIDRFLSVIAFIFAVYLYYTTAQRIARRATLRYAFVSSEES